MTRINPMPRVLPLFVLGVALLFAPACSDSGSGTVTVTTWGELLIEDGLTSDIFPKDHWSVKYSKFLLVYHSVTIADANNKVGAQLDHPLVFDMTQKAQGTPKTLGTYSLEAEAWPNVSYQMGPITSDATAGDLATADDVALLQNDQATVHVEGTGTSPDGVQKTFSWSSRHRLSLRVVTANRTARRSMASSSPTVALKTSSSRSTAITSFTMTCSPKRQCSVSSTRGCGRQQ